jgi:protein-glucosylgalactosylhydroxylysine glucosidase
MYQKEFVKTNNCYENKLTSDHLVQLTKFFYLLMKTQYYQILLLTLISFSGCSKNSKIDRFNLVNRHNVEITTIDSLNSLSVGNGRFAFTVDITGLQTFPEYYSKGIPLGTMSEWGWHAAPNTREFKISDVYKTYEVHGRKIDYMYSFTGKADTFKTAATSFLRANPHRIHLGMIGLQIIKKDGSEISLKDIAVPVQKLDLWTGAITSKFLIEGIPVEIKTVCHPEKDLISAKIESGLLKENRLKIRINFPLGASIPNGYDFNSPDKHSTKIILESTEQVIFERKQDNDVYYASIIKGGSKLKQAGRHIYYLEADPEKQYFEFSCQFSKEMPGNDLVSFTETEKASRDISSKFWSSGGAVDFSECSDTRAFELERRVVLSQYLTRIQCQGSLPPAETGLTYNSWFGKFHLEMHWWHGVHFALWQREDILKKQLEYYFRIYDKALKTARHQGYEGVRWPKMTDPEGQESPSNVGTYLIWQQPHIIYFTELLYQNAIDKKAVLDLYSRLIFSTADFMASYAWYDSTKSRYSLGPVLISAQESLRLETTINPTFEITYWYWGLKTAQEWRKRLGLIPDEKYHKVIDRISRLPVRDGVYLCSEDSKDTWQNERYMRDHPIISGISGMLPETKLVDKKNLASSLDTIMKKWNWKTCWGWDFPMLAMSAASIDRPEQAVDFLMMAAQKNRYLPNGHNYQDARLSIYLPGNGGLLSAVAMMCTSDRFPHNGKWKVRWENLNKIK